MDEMHNYTELQEKLALAREAAGRSLRFMMLDHLEHLLATRPSLPVLPLEGGLRRAHARDLRRNVLRSLGLSPSLLRGSLRPRRLGRVDGPGYVVEKLSFQTLPGLNVPAHLYLPSGAAPWPAVLYASGHFVEDGMMYPDSQCCCSALARQGFAVLAYEAMGQGERGPGWDEWRKAQLPALLVSAHLQGFLARVPEAAARRKWLAWAWHSLQGEHGCLAPLLSGLSQLGSMVGESIRALDYLCTRPDIDARRLGMMGASGGGQNAYYTAAIDARVQAVSVICYLPSLAGQIRQACRNNWWGGGDLCDQVPLHLTYGEYADVGALILPRPLLFVTAQQDDGFPMAEARAEFDRLAPLYRKLAPERLRLAEVAGPHGIARPMREAAYGWFARWLLGKGDGSPLPEPPVSPLPPRAAAMRCMAPGTVARARPALISLARRRAAACARQRGRARSGDDPAGDRDALLGHLRCALGTLPDGDLQPQTVTPFQAPGLEGELVTFGAGPYVRVLASVVRKAGLRRQCPLVLILHDAGWAQVWTDRWPQRLTAAGCEVVLLDVRGTGPNPLRTARPADQAHALAQILLHEDDRNRFVTDFEITSAYLMLGRTLLGERIWDAGQAMNYLLHAEASRAVRCLGIGSGGLAALFLAALDTRFGAIATWRAPVSLAALLVEDPAYPPSAYLFGALRHFDLPDVVSSLSPRPVLIAAPCDGRAGPLSERAITGVYGGAGRRCQAASPVHPQILAGDADENRQRVCTWLAAPPGSDERDTRAGHAIDTDRSPSQQR